MKLIRGPAGRIELWICDRGEQQILEDFGRTLEEKFKAVPLCRATGLDQSYWDYDVDGAKLTLHREHYLGVCLIAENDAGENALKAIAKELGVRTP